MRALVLALVLASPAMAEGAIATDPHVTEVLVAARVGDVIRKTCPSIDARMFAVLGQMNALRAHAEGQGWNEDEVAAFLKDPAQKARIAGLATDYMASQGVVAGDVESHCALGRAEIAKASLTGSLLRSWK